MTLRTSFIDVSIIKYNLKRYWWVSGLSFLVIFLMTLLPILQTNVSSSSVFLQGFLESDAGIRMLIPTFSVLTAVCVLRYLQLPKSANLMHSLPPKRTALFTSSFLSGLFLIAAPIITAMLALMAFCAFTPLQSSLSVIFHWGGVFMLYSAVFYSFAMFVGMFTGSSAAQFIFTYILLLLPFWGLYSCAYLLDGWLFGFRGDGILNISEALLSVHPFNSASACYLDNRVELWQHILEGSYIIIFCLASLFFYSKRNIEASGDIVVFKHIKPVFLYGAATCTAVLGATIIKSGSHTSHVSLIALIVFGLIGYIITKMLLVKSFRILRYYKGAIVFTLIISLLWASVNFNIFGYGKSVPKAEDVESVHLGSYYSYNLHAAENWENIGSINKDNGYWNSSAVILKDEENIKKVITLHKNAINELYPQKYGVYSYVDEPYETYYISYKMKNGQIKTNYYSISVADVYEVFSTKEAKDFIFSFARNGADKIKYIDLCSSLSTHYALSTEDEKNELLEAFNKDINEMTYDEIFGPFLIFDEPTSHTEESFFINFEHFVGGKLFNTTVDITENFKNTREIIETLYPQFEEMSYGYYADEIYRAIDDTAQIN